MILLACTISAVQLCVAQGITTFCCTFDFKPAACFPLFPVWKWWQIVSCCCTPLLMAVEIPSCSLHFACLSPPLLGFCFDLCHSNSAIFSLCVHGQSCRCYLSTSRPTWHCLLLQVCRRSLTQNVKPGWRSWNSHKSLLDALQLQWLSQSAGHVQGQVSVESWENDREMK